MNTQLLSKNLTDIFGTPLSYEEALSLVKEDRTTYETFLNFSAENQEKLLTFIQGQHGLKITYDPFFNYVMSPEYHPDRLESFLTALLGQQVRITHILPREGIQLADSGSLVIMDILAELTDGSLIDVEMQKIGYAFPGQRSSCYVSDLIMRQYNRIRKEKLNKFNYRDMKPVYLIVLMEKSSKEFRQTAPFYIHKEQTIYDSGAEITSLSHTLYISLDTFHEVIQNISTELDAWLTFLSSDAPSDIIKLVTAYPKFQEYYNDISKFRKNPKELINMFSEALAIMDRNTELYMITEMHDTIDELKEQKVELEQTKTELEQTNAELTRSNVELTQSNAELTQSNVELTQSNAELTQSNVELKAQIDSLKTQLKQLQNSK